MAELKLIPYSSGYKNLWDDFVEVSKNGTFLHKRDYLEYHSDRFPDSSLLVFRDDKLYALLPATFNGQIYSSHSGLTYGGLIIDKKATAAEIVRLMEMIRDYVRDLGAIEFLYKPVPHIYHRIPSEEDLYALFRLNASIISRNVSSVIENAHPLKLRDDRKAGVRKALKAGITVEQSNDYPCFWSILSDNLMMRYKARPVHSVEEISRLKESFPDNIHLYLAKRGDEVLGGTVIYTSPTVAHTQYISATPEGKRLHAIDLLLNTLVTTRYASYSYFDFGTSNEDKGLYLNENLISQKEGFGGRAIVYDTYSIPL